VLHGAAEASGSGGVQRVWAWYDGNAVGQTLVLSRDAENARHEKRHQTAGVEIERPEKRVKVKKCN